MPMMVLGEETPFTPEGILWMTEGGDVVGFALARPDDLLTTVLETFEMAMRKPQVGPPRTPARLRVNATWIADAVRTRLGPEVEILVAPTPEIDPVVAKMKARAVSVEKARSAPEARKPAGESYLVGGIDAPRMASFFRTVAALQRAAPWEIATRDSDIFCLDLPSIGVHHAVVSMLGLAGRTRGIMLFDSTDDFADYFSAADASVGRPLPARLSSFLALSLEPAAHLSPDLVAEVAAHGWEIADASAYPRLIKLNENMTARYPLPQELGLLEAAAQALLRLCEDRGALVKALAGGPRVEATVIADFASDKIALRLRAPHPGVVHPAVG